MCRVMPRDGIAVANGHLSFDEVAQAFTDAVQKLTSDPERTVELTGAIQNAGIERRVADTRKLGNVLLDSRPLTHPAFSEAPSLRR